MKRISRREFIGTSAKLFAAASLTGAVGISPAQSAEKTHPNILLIMVDQLQTPPEGYRPGEGMAQGLKEILGFRALSPDNAYTGFFPGLLRLRQNAVVLKKHHTASSACVPSRTCIMTGQYPTLTGVEQTDGLFKSAEEVTFLDPHGAPTIGDWFRAVGYTTHYFGKWHVSEPEKPEYLEPWGFSNWESTDPEPHGGDSYNLGVYRDIGFTDDVVSFLERKGKSSSGVPWLAVGSLVNPHDCSAWPVNWQMPADKGVVPWDRYPPPPSIPAMGEMSLPEPDTSLTVDLNPDGFPQNCGSLPRTLHESLEDKPQCQKDYALKWGLAVKSIIEYNFEAQKLPIKSPLPFQLQGENAEAWSLSYNQFYFYLQYLADLQIRRMLQALDDSGQTDNTIVVFLSDHGDMAGAHGGMIQKWHSAYEEAIRVPMVVSSPLVNKSKRKMREVVQPTSSIDLAPTLLTLAGYDEKRVLAEMKAIHGESVKALAGADLSSHIEGRNDGPLCGPDGKPRAGVLFMSNDMITELGSNPDEATREKYESYLANVRVAIDAGSPLVPGPVRQPNNVRALCTGNWKIVRYVDPKGVEPDEWELYCLKSGPIEKTNVVDFNAVQVRDGVSVPGMTTRQLKLKNTQLKKELAKQEAALLGKSD